MNDRFNIRYFNKNTKKFEYLKIGAVNFNLFTDWTVYEQGQFCTGLKDKNGKLIYEGDILKGKKDMICSPHSSKMVDKVGVVEIPQNMFVASCRDVKNNCTQFCQNDWVKTEVIGNIYENKEFLGSEG